MRERSQSSGAMNPTASSSVVTRTVSTYLAHTSNSNLCIAAKACTSSCDAFILLGPAHTLLSIASVFRFWRHYGKINWKRAKESRYEIQGQVSNRRPAPERKVQVQVQRMYKMRDDVDGKRSVLDGSERKAVGWPG